MDIAGRVEEATGPRNPTLLEFVDGQGLSVTDVRIEQNGMWSVHPVYCDDVLFRDVSVKGGAEGSDVDSCRRVAIDRFDFDTVDDCISLKSGRGLEGNIIARPTEDMTITDCVFRDQRWASIEIGAGTSGGIRRVLVERCRCLAVHTFAIYIKSRPGRGCLHRGHRRARPRRPRRRLRLPAHEHPGQRQAGSVPRRGLDGIPTVRNFTLESIHVVDVPILVEAYLFHPDNPLDGFTMRGITGTSGKGKSLANTRSATL
ncbi:glycosyl hydrolase family 28 protein [Brevundimonas sp. DC300-4]|uniref:glycosyl hydrolase family 28 protein n=1 Tax=Brevundimonas sp. DC300-4 TaxID=2804594 RepID=UPI003CEC3C54